MATACRGLERPRRVPAEPTLHKRAGACSRSVRRRLKRVLAQPNFRCNPTPYCHCLYCRRVRVERSEAKPSTSAPDDCPLHARVYMKVRDAFSYFAVFSYQNATSYPRIVVKLLTSPPDTNTSSRSSFTWREEPHRLVSQHLVRKHLHCVLDLRLRIPLFTSSAGDGRSASSFSSLFYRVSLFENGAYGGKTHLGLSALQIMLLTSERIVRCSCTRQLDIQLRKGGSDGLPCRIPWSCSSLGSGRSANSLSSLAWSFSLCGFRSWLLSTPATVAPEAGAGM
jgi:hypothetical protein